ncbi:hypothetical protein [Streptomyces sp. NPDC053728]
MPDPIHRHDFLPSITDRGHQPRIHLNMSYGGTSRSGRNGWTGIVEGR